MGGRSRLCPHATLRRPSRLHRRPPSGKPDRTSLLARRPPDQPLRLPPPRPRLETQMIHPDVGKAVRAYSFCHPEGSRVEGAGREPEGSGSRHALLLPFFLMLTIGWFSTGRGAGSRKLLAAATSEIASGHLDARIAVVFCNRG